MQEGSQQNPSHSQSKNYKIVPTDVFLSDAKKLAKKYPKIKEDFFDLRNILKKDPITGNDSLGDDMYKVRMQISDKNKGQSGGARVIIQVKIIDKVVYVLSVYDKGKIDNLIDKQLQKLKDAIKPYKRKSN